MDLGHSAAVEAMGGLSVLVNNAGVGGPLSFVEDDTTENWQRQYEINLRSVMFGCKHAMPHLRENAPSSIVNISSIAGLAGAPGMGAYNATKAGVWMYSKTIALEAAKADWNVRVNSVHPVFIKTAILDPFVAMAHGDEAKAHERLARGIPLKRIGEPNDVAYAVLYLASDESKFVTGSEFKIDGGMTAQ
jgi:NAD(P)-dependent dehydrogenase (short-subunit alcohol dehydrogenase family)